MSTNRRSLNRRAVGVGTFCLVLAPCAIGAEVAYRGTWDCDAAPKINIPQFSVPASAVRDGNTLTITRIVYKAGTYEEATRMTGTAAIRDGTVAVEATTPMGGASGRFEGTVSNTDFSLTGVEHVKIADRGEDVRACRVRLRRQ